MAEYEYRARDRSGKLVEGVIEADGPALVAGQLDQLGYFPIRISPRRVWSADIDLKEVIRRFRKVKTEDFILYNRQLATLISAGLPFVRCLDALIEQTKSARLREVLGQVQHDIEGGSAFSDALTRHPDIFSDLYISMIRTGEEGGMLDTVVGRLATLAEQDRVIRARIQAAVRYPLIVVVTLAAAIVVLMKLVVPQFVQVYERFGGELPLPTRMLVFANTIFQHYWLPALGLLALAILGLRSYVRSAAGRRWWDGLKIRIPIFGPLILKASMSRFTRVFSSLLASGISILRTLDIASATADNVVVQEVIHSIHDSVQEGETIAGPMKENRVFPPVVVQMVAVGEETGRLDEMLEKVSDYYDEELEYAIQNLTTAIEPILILVIGGVVLFLALAIFMPWWNVITFIKR